MKLGGNCSAVNYFIAEIISDGINVVPLLCSQAEIGVKEDINILAALTGTTQDQFCVL